MKKIFITTLMCMTVCAANARIETITATGYGPSPYAATMDAIDNAIRQSGPVSIENAGPTNLSEKKFKMTDDREIKYEHSADSEYSASAEHAASVQHSASADGEEKGGSWWSRLKFWEKSSASTESSVSQQASASEDTSYEYKGGTIEVSSMEIQREINAKYKGTIKSYQVVKTQKQKDDSYMVEISVQVNVLDDYKSPDLIKKAEYTVAIVPADGDAKWSCVGQKKSSKTIEEKIIDGIEKPLTKSKKISVVDRDNINKQLKELSLLDTDLANADNANKLHQITVADYLLIIETNDFNAHTSTTEVKLTGEKKTSSSANLDASYKLIETATMEVVSSGDASASINQSGAVSCNSAINKLTSRVATELAETLIDDL